MTSGVGAKATARSKFIRKVVESFKPLNDEDFMYISCGFPVGLGLDASSRSHPGSRLAQTIWQGIGSGRVDRPSELHRQPHALHGRTTRSIPEDFIVNRPALPV
jgi:hypothetical protein